MKKVPRRQMVLPYRATGATPLTPLAKESLSYIYYYITLIKIAGYLSRHFLVFQIHSRVFTYTLMSFTHPFPVKILKIFTIFEKNRKITLPKSLKYPPFFA